jgi:PAS domain S-box-containing protein
MADGSSTPDSALRLARLEAELQRERALFNDGPVVIFRWRAEAGWPVDYVSENIRQFGYTPDDFTSGRVSYASVVHPEDLERIAAEVASYSAIGATTFEQDYRLLARDGEYRALYDYTVIERDAEGRVTHYAGYVLDVTERRQLEAELRHAQRLDSIGRLAGGVAHDFNNLLTAILGSADYALRLVPADNPVHELLESIRLAGRRAAELTRQLQSFARKQPGEPRAVEVNQAVREIASILRRLLGEEVALRTSFCAEPAHVQIDPGHLQQILVNLAVNARDAMPEGGTLSIEISVVPRGKHGLLARSEADEYVRIDMSDSGIGMDASTLGKLFEPFFTTKGPGKGTGLGLAVCLGIAQQAGGEIAVESHVGKGSRFSVLLPRSVAEEPRLAEPPALAAPKRRGRLLLVEDEALVRDFAARVLRDEGYTVLVAEGGERALALALEPGQQIDAVITDVVMPVLGGPELMRRLHESRPELPSVYMSGYPGRPGPRGGRNQQLVHKPFTAQELLSAVAAVLSP